MNFFLHTNNKTLTKYIVSELWAVVNNAGISKGFDIEMTSIEKIEEVLDVNLMGTIRVTKTFLPLLKKSKGRVINIGSAAGKFHCVDPYISNVSKYKINKDAKENVRFIERMLNISTYLQSQQV